MILFPNIHLVMAIWQYHISVYPRDSLQKFLDTNPKSLDINILEEGVLWGNFTNMLELHTNISNILPEWKWWWTGMKLYGNVETDDIQIYYTDENKINNIYIRFDMRAWNKEHARKILDLLNKFELSIFDYKKIILNPTYNSLIESIKESDAWKFSVNPRGFIENLHLNPIDTEEDE